jgi:DNA polymerase-3 subunit gamma/tau
MKNRSLDIVEIDAASQTGVDNVRENIIQSARSIPAMAKRKVFIIDEVHMLSTSAFNALLKLLEEPPAHAMFILATTEIHRIPDTIISRTQRFDFKKATIDDLVARIQKLAAAEKRTVDDDVAMRIARRAGGSVRDAETMLGQLFSFEERHITAAIADVVLPRSDIQVVLALCTDIVEHRTVDALDRFHEFCEQGGDVGHIVHDLILTLRAVLLMAVDTSLLHLISAEYDQADVQQLHSLAAKADARDVQRAIEAFLVAERRLNVAVMIEFPVELAIITATTSGDVPPQAPARPSRVAATRVEPVSTPSTPVVPSEPAPTPPPQKTKPAKRGGSAGQLTLTLVQDAWKAIQRTIGHTHPSLGLTVQQAIIGDVNDEEVILHVPFKLHADRLSDPKYSGPLKQALDDALGVPVRISVLVTDAPAEILPPKVEAPVTPTVSSAAVTAPTTSAKKADLWDQVVSSFGKA